MKVMMTLALNAAGEMVSIKDVHNGHKCNCFCPACEAPLSARQGSLTWSFAHQSKVDEKKCTWTPETELHLRVKQYLATSEVINVPIGLDKPYEYPLKIEAVQVEENMDSSQRRPDITIISNGEKIYVEVFVSNPCKTDKIKEFKRHFANAIEIDFSEFQPTGDTISDNDIRFHLKDFNVFKWLSITPAGFLGQMINTHQRKIIVELKSEYTMKTRELEYEYDLLNTRLKTNNWELDKKNQKLNQKFKSLEYRVNNFEPISAEYERKYQAKEKKLNDLDVKFIRQVEQNRQKAEGEYRSRYFELVDGLRQQLLNEDKQLSEDMNQKNQELVRLQESIASLQTDIRISQRELSRLETEIKSLRGLEQKVDAKMSRLEKVVKTTAQDRNHFERMKPLLKEYLRKTGGGWPFQFDRKENISIDELIQALMDCDELKSTSQVKS